MKRLIFAALFFAVVLPACNSKSGGGGQSTPEGAANMVFTAASSGDYSQLKNLCDASLSPDGDSKRICDIIDGDAEMKDSFKKYFSKGKVVGTATIEGDNAKVNIMFGPDGTKTETLNMAKKDGKWFLVSF